MTFAVLFPGQGSQFSGMGADLFAARPDLLGERADRILGWSLQEMCLEVPEDVLTRTEHAQPALFAVAFALWDELQARLPHLPAAGAGHSLGEYTALAAAQVLDFDEALAVVARRGLAMAAAADQEPSGMAALIGADDDLAEKLCAERRATGGRLYVANLNAPGQVVVAGGEDDISWLESEGRHLGVRRVVRLKVAGAFHSPFMAPAARVVEEALASVSIRPPSFPVWANVTARPVQLASEIATLLVEQVVAPVRFAETLTGMGKDGIDLFLHVGPGEVTAGLAKRGAPGARTAILSDLASIDAVVGSLSSID